MSTNTVLIIFVSLSFVLIAVISGREKADLMVWSLLLGIGVSIIASFITGTPIEIFWENIPVSTIIFLVFFDVLVQIMNQEHLFEYFAIKIIHLTKSKIRLFYYTISIVSALVSGVMMDISVALIFIPIIYRATTILKIESRPFVLGVAFSISIGNLLSPYSAAVNIIISDAAGLTIGWFFTNLFIFFLFAEGITLFIIDLKYLGTQASPSNRAKRILLDIMDPDLLIIKRPRFLRHVVYLVGIIILLFLNITPYLMIMLAVLLICLMERKSLGKLFQGVGWGLPVLLIGLFLLIGCLSVIGTLTLIEQWISSIIGEQFVLALILTLILTAVIGSFISRNFAAVVFLSVFSTLLGETFTLPLHFDVLYLALIIGINLGGNMIPQASSHVLYTLDFVKKNKILHLDFKSYTLITFILSIGYIVMGIIYVLIYYGIGLLI
ncbi:MAG: SLC13 family permease [Promethearchaeota archaeon]